MNAHTPFDANKDWSNPYCQNSSNDPMVDALLGNAYHVVRTVYCNLGNLKLLYEFLNQYGMVIGVQSEAELKALTSDAKYARIYGFSRTGERQVTDYLYVDGDRTGILPNDTTATGSWITVATSGSNGSGGTSSGEGAYIPWVYANGSATGGETTINVPDDTVGVPFIIINGDMQYVGRGFEFNVDNLSVTLAQPLEEGDEVVFLLTGTPAVPDNPNVSDWVQINWLYNGGYASGGEQVIQIPYTFQSVPAIYKNGARYYAGLAENSYTVDATNQRILLTEPLATNDRLIVTIGGESETLIMSDRTIQEVARSANVKDTEIILSTNTTQYLNDKKVIYDVVEQKIYGLPLLPTNIYIGSVSNGKLTYNPGNITVDLVPIPDSAEELSTTLASASGASSIGAASGNTVQEDLDELLNRKGIILTPEMFSNGTETNHTAVFKAMLAEAKAKGLSVSASGTYVLDAHPTDPIDIEVPADFSAATIICTTNDGNSENWNNTSILFRIPQESQDVTAQFASETYARGKKAIDVKGLSGWLSFESTDVWLQRKSNAAAAGSPQYKIEVNETDQKGALSYNHYHTFTSAPTVSYKPFVNELTFKAPNVILDGAGIGWVVFCERNNVNILGNSITSKNNGFAMTFITFNRCARSYIADYNLDANFPETYAGGYTVLLTQASSVTAERINSPSGWSGIDGNYYRGLTVRDSKLRSVGGHCGVSDVLIQGCTITNHCNGMGWGTWTALNCHHNLSLDKTNDDFWSTKYDYNNSWDGKVIIRDLKVTLHSGCTGHSVVTAMEPKADHGMLGYCPDIYVNNVEYDIANTSSNMDIRTINLGVSSGNNYEQYQVLPQFHTVDGVTFGGGSNRYLGNTNYRVIYNERNYTNITSTQMNAINRSGSRYIAKVSNIELERLGRINQDWVNAARVDGFKFTSYGTKQEIYIDRSAHVIPCTSAWTDMKITVSNQRMNKGFLDNAVTRTGNNSYNKLTFTSCEIFGVGGTGPTYRSGLFDFVGCIFRWDSDSDKAIAAPATTMGTDFGSGVQVTGRIQSCVLGTTPASSTVDATLKTRILSGYTNAGVYTIS